MMSIWKVFEIRSLLVVEADPGLKRRGMKVKGEWDIVKVLDRQKDWPKVFLPHGLQQMSNKVDCTVSSDSNGDSLLDD
jgi:hypothetical protein